MIPTAWLLSQSCPFGHMIAFGKFRNRCPIVANQLLSKHLPSPGIARGRIGLALLHRTFQAAEKCHAGLAIVDVAIHLLADCVVYQPIHVIGKRCKHFSAARSTRRLDASMARQALRSFRFA